MTDEKICPFMSHPVIAIQTEPFGYLVSKQEFVSCLKEKCMAWVPECPRLNAADRECESEDCIAMDRDFQECKGGCRLI